MAEELFPSKKPEKRGKESISPSLSSEISRIGSRLRMLEDTINNLRSKQQITEQNLLSSNKIQNTEIKAINSDLNEVKRNMDDIRDDIKVVMAELKTAAKKEEILTLKKYIDLWQPLNFVTRNEVEKLIKELLEERKV